MAGTQILTGTTMMSRFAELSSRELRKPAKTSWLAAILAFGVTGASLAEDTIPVPEPKPVFRLPGEEPPPKEKKSAAIDPALQQTGPSFSLGQAKACEKELRALGARFEVLSPLVGDGPCGAQRPLQLTQLPGGISVPKGVTTRCRVALALAKWTKETVVPSAEVHLSAKVTGVDVATSYHCRRRNNAKNGKFSEHAFANGVDITGFRFEDRERLAISVRNGTANPDRAFQAAVRGASCAYFTTVIGPTTNISHADHLHLDMAERRGGYRLCQ